MMSRTRGILSSSTRSDVSSAAAMAGSAAFFAPLMRTDPSSGPSAFNQEFCPCRLSGILEHTPLSSSFCSTSCFQMSNNRSFCSSPRSNRSEVFLPIVKKFPTAKQVAEKVDSKRFLVAQALLPVRVLLRLLLMHSQEWL